MIKDLAYACVVNVDMLVRLERNPSSDFLTVPLTWISLHHDTIWKSSLLVHEFPASFSAASETLSHGMALQPGDFEVDRYAFTSTEQIP